MMSLRVFCIGPLGSIEPSRMSWSSVSTAPRSAGRVRRKARKQKGEERRSLAPKSTLCFADALDGSAWAAARVAQKASARM